MRLFEAIVDANHRALRGDSSAGLRPVEYADSLPIVALSCIDPRLNRLLPDVLGVPEEQFIWLRNAGNIIFDPMSSMTRTLALACAVKGGREIAIIGHTDCRVRQTSVSELIERFRALGIDRARLPENLVEFFGLFASERQNVITGAGTIRQSPLISSHVPVHGLLADIETGRLEWLVNGYEKLDTGPAPVGAVDRGRHQNVPELLDALGELKLGDTKLSETKIGEGISNVVKWLSEVQVPDAAQKPPVPPAEKAQPAPIPVPPRLRALASKLKGKR